MSEPSIGDIVYIVDANYGTTRENHYLVLNILPSDWHPVQDDDAKFIVRDLLTSEETYIRKWVFNDGSGYGWKILA